MISPSLKPYWAAPEIILKKEASLKSDIFSLGMLFSHLLTRGEISEEWLDIEEEVAADRIDYLLKSKALEYSRNRPFQEVTIVIFLI